MNERAFSELHELGRRDEELASAAAQLQQLEATVARIRARAEAMDEFFATYPERESRSRESVDAAQAELERRRAELAAAETEVASGHNDDDRILAEKALARAVDHVGVAEASLERARSAYEALEGDAAELPIELEQLEAETRVLRGSHPGLPAAGTGPRGLIEWASHAHAELFVGLSQLATERDRLSREANELASMLLAEPTYGSTVAQAIRQVEATR